jgi:hypothetical protein
MVAAASFECAVVSMAELARHVLVDLPIQATRRIGGCPGRLDF